MASLGHNELRTINIHYVCAQCCWLNIVTRPASALVCQHVYKKFSNLLKKMFDFVRTLGSYHSCYTNTHFLFFFCLFFYYLMFMTLICIVYMKAIPPKLQWLCLSSFLIEWFIAKFICSQCTAVMDPALIIFCCKHQGPSFTNMD